MRRIRSALAVRAALALALAAAALPIAAAAARRVAQTPTYTVVRADDRRLLPFRTVGGADLVLLDQAAALFGLTLREDALAGGLVVTARGERLVLTAGQPLVSVGGRLVSLPGPVVRDGAAWFVPVEFLSRAVGPATGVRIEVRRASRLIVVGEVRLPRLGARFERTATGLRLVVDATPPTPARLAREGDRLVIRFDADGLDATPPPTPAPEFVAGLRVEGASLVVDLGPQAVAWRAAGERDAAPLTVDLGPAAAPPASPARPAPGAPEPPVLDIARPGVVRTIVIDAGHGGDDAGARGPGGSLEKDATLDLARRLKAAIEGRIGLRVLLTREADTEVLLDRRTAIANNNKADLFISLHANAAMAPGVRGVQVLSLALDDYPAPPAGRGRGTPVPLVGGGMRVIEAVPWDLAQAPHATRSAAFGAIIVRHLAARGVPLHARPADLAPLRVLAGANMPAVIIEAGFLTHPGEERAIASGELGGPLVEALLAAILEVRDGIPVGPVRREAR